MGLNESLMILPTIDSLVTVEVAGGVLRGVVTRHDSKDGKPIFDYQYDHVMPDGTVVKADKWAWLEQLIGFMEPNVDLPVKHPLCQFEYQLLGRLQQDCEYYLGAGGRNQKHLWALDETLQIKKMKELYESLPVKPNWITFEAINGYEKKMVQTQI